MARSLQVIKTLPVLPGHLLASSVAEDDAPAWGAAQTYAEGDRVLHDHAVFESVQAGNTGHPPGQALDWWSRIGPANRWRAFDLSSSTQTLLGASSWFVLQPGQPISHVSLLNLSGVASARVRLLDGAQSIYDQTLSATVLMSESSWYAWTFEPREPLGELVFSGLPAHMTAQLRVEIEGSSAAAVGVIAYGTQREIGKGVRYGARIGIQDFSRKERNAYGDTHLVQRAFAKEASFTVIVPNSEVSNVYALLASLRATPCLWIGAEHLRLTTLWGFYRSFTTTISHAQDSELAIELEGLA